MIKMKYVICVLLSSLIGTSFVGAATCDTDEKASLNNLASNVVVNYEVKEVELHDVPVPDTYEGTEQESEYYSVAETVMVNVLNLNEKIKVEVYDDSNRLVKTINYSDTTNGNISFSKGNLEKLEKYTFVIKASNSTNCNGEEIKVLYLQIPRFNKYSYEYVCNIVPDYYLCQKFVTFDEVDYEFFRDNINKELEKVDLMLIDEETKKNEGKSFWNKTKEFVKDNKYVFITIGALVVIGGATFIVIKKRRDEI